MLFTFQDQQRDDTVTVVSVYNLFYRMSLRDSPYLHNMQQIQRNKNETTKEANYMHHSHIIFNVFIHMIHLLKISNHHNRQQSSTQGYNFNIQVAMKINIC